MSEWMPIETAPRDGTAILAHNPATGHYITTGEFVNDEWEWPMRSWGQMSGIWYPRPTHWQPLPPAPEADDA